MFWKIFVSVSENTIYLRIALHDLCTPLFVFSAKPGGNGDGFEHMAERPVPDVMQKRCQKHYLFAIRIPFSVLTHDDIRKPTRHEIYADAVCEAAVGGTRKNQIGETQLTNAAQTLKLTGIHQFPRDSIRIVPSAVTASAEDDQSVDRIPNTLGSFFVRRHRA